MESLQIHCVCVCVCVCVCDAPDRGKEINLEYPKS